MYVCSMLSHSVVSDSMQPYGQQPIRLLCSWDSPGKNPGVGCHALLQEIFPIQGSNPGLLGVSCIGDTLPLSPSVKLVNVYSCIICFRQNGFPPVSLNKSLVELIFQDKVPFLCRLQVRNKGHTDFIAILQMSFLSPFKYFYLLLCSSNFRHIVISLYTIPSAFC